jgi:hypothetical protein
MIDCFPEPWYLEFVISVKKDASAKLGSSERTVVFGHGNFYKQIAYKLDGPRARMPV